MLRYLLDTSLCIRILRSRPLGQGLLFDRLQQDEDYVCTSTIVMTELLHGAAMSAKPAVHFEQTRRLLARAPVLDFDAAAAEHAADIKADLQRKGALIGSNDLLIAGHARSRGLIVVTGNLREFQRVDGLRCEDWPAGPAGRYL